MSGRVVFVGSGYQRQEWEDDVMTPNRYLGPCAKRWAYRAPLKFSAQPGQEARQAACAARVRDAYGWSVEEGVL